MTRSLLEDVAAFLRRFIVFASDAQVTAVALWLLHTHAVDAAEVTPYLNVCSPEKRSGKSRLLELLAALAARAEHVANISEAALFRMLGTTPTLMVDEVDACSLPTASGPRRCAESSTLATAAESTSCAARALSTRPRSLRCSRRRCSRGSTPQAAGHDRRSVNRVADEAQGDRRTRRAIAVGEDQAGNRGAARAHR
jgi:hypothetical protein